ncbi:hypothetical protein XENORESO_002537 [Xenotaenia resolanae]|uniref:Uncharacterized protein n=1 Tax=Xenotaenia resolanae TaxID=208358 RepID=A0ABV0X780_9TELE
MDREQSNSQILYRNKLNSVSRQRHLEKKIRSVNGLDPYAHSEWSSGLHKLPELMFPGVFGYLVCGVSAYTHEQLQNYKSLEAHLQFTNGRVQDLQIYRVNHINTVVLTKLRADNM